MKNYCALLVGSFFWCTNIVFSQFTNSLKVAYLNPLVYNTKNSISDNFHSIENGNVQLKSIAGVGIYYTKLVHANWGLHLNTGFECIRQNYQLPYYVHFASTKTVTKQHYFSVNSINLQIGLQKKVPIFKDKIYFKIGADLVVRSMNSDAQREINQNAVYFATSDTVLIGFNAYVPSNGGTLVLEANTGFEIKLWQNLRLSLDCALSPRYKIGFAYNVTAVQAYWFEGEFYKFVWSDSKIDNEYVIQSIRLGLGLKWVF